jgi:hypothetical protein
LDTGRNTLCLLGQLDQRRMQRVALVVEGHWKLEWVLVEVPGVVLAPRLQGANGFEERTAIEDGSDVSTLGGAGNSTPVETLVNDGVCIGKQRCCHVHAGGGVEDTKWRRRELLRELAAIVDLSSKIEFGARCQRPLSSARWWPVVLPGGGQGICRAG